MSDQPTVKELKWKSAAWRLWNRRYDVFIPMAYLYSPGYVEKVGIHASGSAQVDNAQLNNSQRVRKTGSMIAAIYQLGCPVHHRMFVKKDQCFQYYDDIIEHLCDWRELTRQGADPEHLPPIEELRSFEEVAITFHEYINSVRPKVVDPTKKIRNSLMNLNQGRSPLRNRATLEKMTRNEDGVIKPFKSIVDEIENIFQERIQQFRSR